MKTLGFMGILLCILIGLAGNRLIEEESATNETENKAQPKADTVLLHLDKNTEFEGHVALSHIESLLDKAIYPGNSGLYVDAHTLLLQQERTEDNLPHLLYLEARIRQHYHQFDHAIELLKKSIALSAFMQETKVLLLSNLLMANGRFEEAYEVCSQLVGTIDNKLVGACILQVKMQIEPTKNFVNEAASILNQPLSKSVFEQNGQLQPYEIWIAEILSSIYMQAGEVTAAEATLKPLVESVNRAELPVSFWALWSDVQFALGKPERVLNELHHIMAQTQIYDDALLLKLALAEQQASSASDKWRNQLASRIKLREQRSDIEHAYDIASYYFYILGDTTTALHWAQINVNQVKLIEDKQLLNSIQQAHLAGKNDENS